MMFGNFNASLFIMARTKEKINKRGLTNMINKSKSCLYEKNQSNWQDFRQTKHKKTGVKQTQIIKVNNQKGDIIMFLTKIEKIIREYYE